MPTEIRVVAGGDSAIQRKVVSKNGKTITLVVYAKPSNLIEEYEMRSCLGLIGDGGAVNTDSASEELAKGEFVGVVRIDGEIVGTGSIKRQRPDYAAGIAHKSSHAFDPSLHELGYIAVNQAHRGYCIGEIIVHHLLFAFYPRSRPTHKPPLFATTSNEAMKIILAREGFTHKGTEWRGVKGDLLGLWMFEPE